MGADRKISVQLHIIIGEYLNLLRNCYESTAIFIENIKRCGVRYTICTVNPF